MEDINGIMNNVITAGEKVDEMIVEVKLTQKETNELEDYFGIKGIITILVDDWLDFFITITYLNHFKRILGLSHLALFNIDNFIYWLDTRLSAPFSLRS